MSDAAEYWHRQYEALKREHVALIEQTAALRDALTTLAIFYPYGGQQSNTWQCRLCRYVNIHESGCVLAAPEAAPAPSAPEATP